VIQLKLKHEKNQKKEKIPVEVAKPKRGRPRKGEKRNSKGYKVSWTGYKLHIDAIDGGIPISCLLTSASMHDNQAAIPLAEITHKKIKSCYDLMDAVYDSSTGKR